MADKINITNENVADYITPKSREYIRANLAIKKLQPIRLFIFALFFSLCLLAFEGMGYFMVSLPKMTKKGFEYSPFTDMFAVIIEKSIYIYIAVSILFFVWFMYVLIKDFYRNKLKRLLAVEVHPIIWTTK